MDCRHDALYGSRCLRCGRQLTKDEYLAAGLAVAIAELDLLDYALAEMATEGDDE